MNFYEHPAYIGYANDQPNDDRQSQWEEQFNKQGFDDSSTWSLDDTIIRFITPRLKRFVEISKSINPSNEFHKITEEMLEGFELYMSGTFSEYNSVHKEKIDRSFKLLAENYRGLWW